MQQPDSDQEENIVFLLSTAARAAARDLQARLHPYGVTPPQLCVLTCLWEENGLSGTALSERAGFDLPTITGILDRLERQELVSRNRDTEDRRVVTVRLTERGEALREALPCIARESSETALAGFNAGEVAGLIQALYRVAANYDQARSRG